MRSEPLKARLPRIARRAASTASTSPCVKRSHYMPHYSEQFQVWARLPEVFGKSFAHGGQYASRPGCAGIDCFGLWRQALRASVPQPAQVHNRLAHVGLPIVLDHE
jgi:hypothetical protein